MLSFIIALILIFHGLIHFLGFVVPWGIAKVDGLPYRTTIFAGKLNVGAIGIRFVGLIWLLIGLGFITSGIALLGSFTIWQWLALLFTLFSLVITVIGWPDSRWGFFANLVIMAGLIFGGHLGWLPKLPAM